MEKGNLETIQKSIASLRREVVEIKLMLEENFELSEEAELQLEESRARPISQFVNHERVVEEFIK